MVVVVFVEFSRQAGDLVRAEPRERGRARFSASTSRCSKRKRAAASGSHSKPTNTATWTKLPMRALVDGCAMPVPAIDQKRK